MKNFAVLRIANKADGTVAVPVTTHETEAEAWKAFYRQCGLAVDSANPTDSVAILNKNGFQLDHRSFTHEVPPEDPGE